MSDDAQSDNCFNAAYDPDAMPIDSSYYVSAVLLDCFLLCLGTSRMLSALVIIRYEYLRVH